MKMSDRKVNKPRLTLRKNKDRELSPIYRGVLPVLLRFGASASQINPHSPEELLQIIGTIMRDPDPQLALSPKQLVTLRSYLRTHSIADWTRGSNESNKRETAARNARSKKNT